MSAYLIVVIILFLVGLGAIYGGIAGWALKKRLVLVALAIALWVGAAFHYTGMRRAAPAVTTSERLSQPTPTVATVMTTSTTVSEAPPFFEGKIAFHSQRGGNIDIYVMNGDGDNAIRLTDHSARDIEPAWSPNGRKIVFASARDSANDLELYVMNSDGSKQFRLMKSLFGFDLSPQWSPDGGKIVYQSTRDGNFELYVINSNGTDWLNLSNDPARDMRPSWSPDGTKIAFVSNRDGNDEIYIMNSDGTNQTRIINERGNDTMPRWSPDGQEILFVSDRNGNSDIYVMNSDGTNQRNLTDDSPADDATPCWASGGHKIVFSSERDGDWELYIMESDGSNQVRLTYSEGFDRFPAWIP